MSGIRRRRRSAYLAQLAFRQYHRADDGQQQHQRDDFEWQQVGGEELDPDRLDIPNRRGRRATDMRLHLLGERSSCREIAQAGAHRIGAEKQGNLDQQRQPERECKWALTTESVSRLFATGVE